MFARKSRCSRKFIAINAMKINYLAATGVRRIRILSAVRPVAIIREFAFAGDPM